jgi:GT2 family glycosyltransferase
MNSFKLNNKYRVIAVVVTYGERGELLKKTVEAIAQDKHITKIIIVDNDSLDKNAIKDCVSKYGERIYVLVNEKNIGSAGGFSAGIKFARSEDVDYLYLSDDDVIISDNFVDSFKSAHNVIGDNQTVLCARRKSFWAGTDVHYVQDEIIRPRQYFNIFSWRIIGVFLKTIFRIKEKRISHKSSFFFPIIPSQGWSYAGVFIPINATREAPLPDTSLGLYLDDIVYSWGITDAGYKSFALMEPHLVDIELTHLGEHTSTGIFSESVSSTKIYYETRNRVRVSLSHGEISSMFIFKLKVIVWCIGVCLLGIIKQGLNIKTISRIELIIESLLAGFNKKRAIPSEIAVRI